MNTWKKNTSRGSLMLACGLALALILTGCQGFGIEPSPQPTATPACSIVDFSLAIKPLLEEFQGSYYKLSSGNLNTEQVVYERGVSLRLQEDLDKASCGEDYPALKAKLGAVFHFYEQALTSALNENPGQAQTQLESAQQALADFEEAYRVEVEDAGY